MTYAGLKPTINTERQGQGRSKGHLIVILAVVSLGPSSC
jgi:hypothetical protein